MPTPLPPHTATTVRASPRSAIISRSRGKITCALRMCSSPMQTLSPGISPCGISPVISGAFQMFSILCLLYLLRYLSVAVRQVVSRSTRRTGNTVLTGTVSPSERRITLSTAYRAISVIG